MEFLKNGLEHLSLLGKASIKKRPFFWFFSQNGGGGVGGNAKRLQSFFINYVFFGVFQNDPGPLKYALELRSYVKYMFFPPFHCSL